MQTAYVVRDLEDLSEKLRSVIRDADGLRPCGKGRNILNRAEQLVDELRFKLGDLKWSLNSVARQFEVR